MSYGPETLAEFTLNWLGDRFPSQPVNHNTSQEGADGPTSSLQPSGTLSSLPSGEERLQAFYPHIPEIGLPDEHYQGTAGIWVALGFVVMLGIVVSVVWRLSQ